MYIQVTAESSTAHALQILIISMNACVFYFPSSQLSIGISRKVSYLLHIILYFSDIGKDGLGNLGRNKSFFDLMYN